MNDLAANPCGQGHSNGRFARMVLIVLWVAGVAGFTGCFGSGTPQTVVDESKLKPLVLLYSMYPGSHSGSMPPNEAEFKKFIATRQDVLTRFKTTADKLLISDRDQKPYKIYYGVPSTFDGVVIHEQDGSGGTRLVGYARGGVQTLPDAEFQKAKLPGKS